MPKRQAFSLPAAANFIAGGATIRNLLGDCLKDRRCAFSMGGHGAIAEFMHTDSQSRLTADGLGLRSDKGAIAYFPARGLRVFRPDRPASSQGLYELALCLPDEAARMHRRTTLTEVGPDRNAIVPGHAAWPRFDLGVSAAGTGCPQVDFCIRTANPELLDVLRRHSNHNVFSQDNPVIAALIGKNPVRIADTRVGRIEVYQAIPDDKPGARTPTGPHTHLLPSLIASGPGHFDLPEEYTACAHIYAPSELLTVIRPGTWLAE